MTIHVSLIHKKMGASYSRYFNDTYIRSDNQNNTRERDKTYQLDRKFRWGQEKYDTLPPRFKREKEKEKKKESEREGRETF